MTAGNYLSGPPAGGGGIIWIPGIGPVPNIPGASPQPGGVDARSPRELNRAASSASRQQATVAGANSVIPICYGYRRIGAKIAAALVDEGDLILLAVWSIGEIDGIDAVTINDATNVSVYGGGGQIPYATFARVDYMGTTTQGVDPTLSAAYARAGRTYADTLRGAGWSAAYSVLRIPVAAGISGFPRITATLRGKKVANISGAAVIFDGSNDGAYAPDSTQTRVDEDFTFDARLTLADWTPAGDVSIASKWDYPNNRRTWAITLTTTGALRLWISTTGANETTYTSTAAVPFTNAIYGWIRVAFVKSNGANSVATFYTSGDGLSWAQLGAAVTGAVVASIYQGIAETRISYLYGSNFYASTVYFASMTTPTKRVFEFMPFGQLPGATTWASKTSETWTLIGGASVYAAAVWYSRTPADILADFIRSTDYGIGRGVEYRHLFALWAANAEWIGAPAEQRHVLDLTIDTPQPAQTWLNVLRDYAHAWAVPEGDEYILVRDYPDASVAAFTETNIVAGTLRIAKRGANNQATVVEVTYTETGALPWRDNTVTQYFPGVLSGEVSRRLSRIAKPGLTRYSEANRYAIEVLNESTLADLSITFQAFDDAARVRVGSLVTVTHPIGFAAKPFRVVKWSAVGPGRYAIEATEYDPALYSTTVATGPTIVDTVRPSPASPPTVSSLYAIEERYQTQNSLWASRIRVTWALPASYPSQFVRAYRVEAFEGSTSGARAFLAEVTTTEFITPPLRELVQYVVRVTVISTSGASGGAATYPITPNGKQFIPTDVAGLTGFEAGGIVFLSWQPAIDVTEDVLRYEVKRGTTSSTWGTATRADRVDALTLAVEGLQAGTYRFFVKAIDSIGQYSTNAATVDVTVTIDQSAFLVTDFPSVAPSPRAMTLYASRDEKRYATDWADGWEHGATTINNASGTFNDSLNGEDAASPHSGAILFEGSSPRVDVPHVAAFNVGTSFTIESWVFLERPLGLADAALGIFSTTYAGTGGGEWMFGVYTTGTSAVAYATNIYDQNIVVSSVNLERRKWHHLALVCNGGGTEWYMVQDGVDVSSSRQSYTPSNNSNAKTIGAYRSGGGGGAFYGAWNGLIKRVRFWNRAFNVAECKVSASYGGVPPGYTGCIGNWRMDDKADGDTLTTTVADTTATSNGTGNAITWRAASELVSEAFDIGGTVTGVFSGAAEFSAMTGAGVWFVETSTDGATWARVYAQSARANARYFRVGLMSESGGAVSIKDGTFRGVASIAPKSEMGTIACLASGVQTVTLQNGYSAVLSIQLTPNASAHRVAVFDQVETSRDRGFRKGRALKLAGASGPTGDYATCGDHAVHTFGDGTTDLPFSVEAWIRPTAIGAVQIIASKGSGGPTGEWNVRLGSNGQVRFLLMDLSATAIKAVDTQFAVPAGSWTHIACTYDGMEGSSTAGMRIYFNGIPQSVTATSSGTYVAMENTTDPLIIGNQYNGNLFNVPFLGQLDELRLWSTERTAQQIVDNMNAYVATNASGLVGYWKMDETSGTTANDSTSNAKHATLSGVASFRPYDGFDVYLFNDAGARVAGDVSYHFQGA